MEEMNEAPSMSPMNLIKILFKRKEWIIVPTFLGLVGAVCFGMLLPKEYKSSSVILVQEGKSDNPLFDDLAVSSTVKERLHMIRESMLGWTSMVELVERMGMDKDIKTAQQLEGLVSSLRNKIRIGLRSQRIISISFSGENPAETKKVVENITDIFLARNVEIQNEETGDAVTFISEQLKVYLGKIKSSEIAKLRDRLQTLLIDSTEKHPQVKQLRERIAALEKELEAENLEYTESSKLSPDTNNAIIEEIQQSINALEGSSKESGEMGEEKESSASSDLYKMMMIEKMGNVMSRDIDVNRQIYNMLLKRLETAKITQRLQSSKEGTKYVVLDPPRVPLKPFKPNKTKIALMGLAGGLGFGIAIVFLIEFLDKSFIDVEDANVFFGTPLLGAISKIETAASIKARREKQFWIYTIAIILGVIAVVLTKAFTNFLGQG